MTDTEGASDAERADGAPSDDELPTWQIVTAVATAVVVLIAGSIGAWLLFGDDDDGDAFGPAPSVSTPVVDEPGVRDSFDRAGERSLGVADDGSTWSVVSGSWGIEDGAARVVDPNPDGPRSVAVVDMGGSDGTVGATVTRVAQGWGLVFRYRGSFNYWMVTAAPDYATYNVQKVVDGQLESVGSLGLAATRDGVEVRVELRGPLIEVFVDGDLVGSFEDPHLQGATQVGLVAQGAAAELGLWDDFWAEPAATSAVPALPSPPAVTTAPAPAPAPAPVAPASTAGAAPGTG